MAPSGVRKKQPAAPPKGRPPLGKPRPFPPKSSLPGCSPRDIRYSRTRPSTREESLPECIRWGNGLSIRKHKETMKRMKTLLPALMALAFTFAGCQSVIDETPVPKSLSLERRIEKLQELGKSASPRRGDYSAGIAAFNREISRLAAAGGEKVDLRDILFVSRYGSDKTSVLVEPRYYVDPDVSPRHRINFTPFFLPKEYAAELCIDAAEPHPVVTDPHDAVVEQALPKHRALERSIARIKALDKDASIREQYDGIADFERELFGIVQKAREEKGIGDEARYFVAFLWDVSYVDDATVLVQPWYYVHRDTHGQFRVNFTPFTIPRELVSRL